MIMKCSKFKATTKKKIIYFRRTPSHVVMNECCHYDAEKLTPFKSSLSVCQDFVLSSCLVCRKFLEIQVFVLTSYSASNYNLFNICDKREITFDVVKIMQNHQHTKLIKIRLCKHNKLKILINFCLTNLIFMQLLIFFFYQ